MKTQNLLRLSLMLVAAAALTFTSCKKDDLNQGTVDASSLEQLSTDENAVESVMNDAEADIVSVIDNPSGSYKSTEWIPCNATVDSLAVANDTVVLYITYNGLNCNGTRNRTGKIEIRKKVGTQWHEAGAAVKYTYINFTVTRVSTGKSVTLNGTKTFENVNGGHRWMVGTYIDSYVEKISGNLQASFDNGTSRTWNVARQLTFTGAPGTFILNIDGFGNSGEYQNLSVWGTNRQGEEFYTQINQSIVCKETCDGDPVSGIKIHQIPSGDKSATITFGYNSNNEPITGDECPTRYRVDWQKGNRSGTSYLPI